MGFNVAHFEDDPGYRLLVKDILLGTNHEVVAEASDLIGSLAVLDQVKAGEVDVDVVLLGGDLSDRAIPMDSEDPAVITRAIEERDLKTRLRTVGLSGLTMEAFGVTVDCDLGKAWVTELPHVLDAIEAVMPGPRS